MKKRILFIAFSLSTLMAIAMPGKNSLKSTPQEMDKFVTELMKKMTIGNKDYTQLNNEERAFIDTYGKEVDFTKQNDITPLIDYIKNHIDR